MTDPQAAAQALAGKRILIVEDQYLIASDLRHVLEGVNVVVVGPASTASMGLSLVEEGIDAAILDVNLRGSTSFDLAEQLAHCAIPYMFLTGKDGSALPEAFRDVPHLLKPYRMGALLDCLHRLTSADAR